MHILQYKSTLDMDDKDKLTETLFDTLQTRDFTLSQVCILKRVMYGKAGSCSSTPEDLTGKMTHMTSTDAVSFIQLHLGFTTEGQRERVKVILEQRWPKVTPDVWDESEDCKEIVSCTDPQTHEEPELYPIIEEHEFPTSYGAIIWYHMVLRKIVFSSLSSGVELL